MKKIALVTVLLCVSGSALAADVGLGVSIRSGDATIYMPIHVSKAFRIEPMLAYQNDQYERRLIPNSPYTLTAIDDYTTLTLGVGLFGVTELAESASVYYGGRVGYLARETETTYVGSVPPGAGLMASKVESDGFLLAPTIGLEYRFSKHFSISGEAALAYTELEGDDYSNESTSTSTNIIFRYLF